MNATQLWIAPMLLVAAGVTFVTAIVTIDGLTMPLMAGSVLLGMMGLVAAESGER